MIQTTKTECTPPFRENSAKLVKLNKIGLDSVTSSENEAREIFKTLLQ